MVRSESSGGVEAEVPLPAASQLVLERLMPLRQQLAVLADFDGTLSPIVDDPEAARADPAAGAAFERLAELLPLVAVVTGRPALTARRLLGIDTISITGLHGAEVLAPGATEPVTPPAFAADGVAVQAIVAAAQAEPEGLGGLDLEEKGPIVALHWRSVADPVTAEARARELGARAEAAGLRSGLGRSVLEIRPATEITKGDGAAALIAQTPGVRHAVFAGDDITDLDGFAALRRLVADGQLDSATLIAVSGADAPPQVAAAADLVLPDPAALGAFLTALTTGD
jgi:trehalose 6-phosphate phosphatase